MIWENLKYAMSLKSGEEEFLEGRVKRVGKLTMQTKRS